MRNLILAATTLTTLQNANITTTAFDLDLNVIYATSECVTSDGEVEVEIWKAPGDETSPPAAFTKFTAIASTSGSEIPQVVSFRVLPEIRKLSVIMRNGDITMIDIDESGVPQSDVEGTVEPGVMAASWSPDDALLVLVTGQDKLILMTSTFDVLSEVPIHTSDFGEDAPINVGWGSKQTQFHGSLGKGAAQAPAVMAVGSSPDDDEIPRISWRGDGAFFVISTLSPPEETNRLRRTLRVYDREAMLQSTSEPVAGLEHPLVWRPSGNLIAGTQRFGFEGGGAGKEGRHDVVFFERNGLRHGEFGIRATDLGPQSVSERTRWGYKIREMSWSSDSNILALWIERREGDIVQLWTIGNYHWYLKQEVIAPAYDGLPGRFTSVAWHPEQALHMILTTNSVIIQRIYAWEVFVSSLPPPMDSGTVAVVDGTNILLTPFRVQNVPPPMSSCQIALSASSPSPVSRTPVYADFSSISDSLAILWETGYAEIWSLRIYIHGGRDKVVDPTRVWFGQVCNNARQIKIFGTKGTAASSLVVLSTNQDSDCLTFLEPADVGGATGLVNVLLPQRNNYLIATDDHVAFEDSQGNIYRYDSATQIVSQVSHFPELCLQSQSISAPPLGDTDGALPSDAIYVGLGGSGKLHVTSGNSTHVLATDVTSFAVASGFVILTTTAHEAIFIPQTRLRALLDGDDNATRSGQTGWETRRIERGSRIVVAVPSAMSVVLQMPRGNLETIHPRPIVMEVIKQSIDTGNYHKAFFACRKHRIDLNTLVEQDQAKFLERIPSFVYQIHEVDHLNLFLTGLSRGKLPLDVVATLCDAIRSELESKNFMKYIKSILTAYIVKTPPDHQSGLSLLGRLRETNPDLVEDAVKYIIFLVDIDQLFDTALGMYDFSLVLMIAQHAQKDPREYLPFLRELRALEKYYQRFKIDDYLKRYESALRNLSLAGAEHFDEAVAYVERHQLYMTALRIWKGSDHYKTILELYGDWLFERREFKQAASVFVEAEMLAKAMTAHEKALQWQELFFLVAQTQMVEEDIVAAGYRVAEDLTSKKRYSEAARVLLDYSRDVRHAVITLVEGNYFSEARRIIAINRQPELTEDIVHPAAFETCAQVLEDINECHDQLSKQVNRLRELRVKKVDEPDAFYGIEDANLHNIDVMTDVSMAPTAFTRYTIAPSTASRTSKQSSRSKRKMERKVGSGRKGTVDEEEYLLKSLTKLTMRFAAIQGEAGGLLPHLLQLTPEHSKEGREMQRRVMEFETQLKNSLEEVWFKPPEETPVDGWASRMEEIKKRRNTNPIDQVPKPELPRNTDWQMVLLELE